MPSELVLSVDVGGTFTDFVVQREGRQPTSFKMLTDPKSPEKTVLKGLELLGAQVSELLHATTLGTNVLLGQSDLPLPKVALLVTKGFRDIISIGRQNRPSLYDLFFEKKKTLVQDDFIFEVAERTDFEGKVRREVSGTDLASISSKIDQAESVAVLFLHSYVNPENEIRAKEILRKNKPKISLCVSSEVAPEPREYERGSTTIINALLVPLVGKYIRAISASLDKEVSFHVMSSSSGLLGVQEAQARPAQLVESGPAAGVLASAELGRALGENRVISFDMGGTTAKACAVVDYEPEMTSEYEVGGRVHHGRVVKGTGYPILFPFLDVAEVSSGGGTIVWRDAGGALRVGPNSAGSQPGPMCYGRGGQVPTLTDANVAVGRLGTSLLGGQMKISKDLALSGIKRIGEAPLEVAVQAIELANLEMARAVRLVTVERGLDPEGFALVAFGGAGPQHAAEIAARLLIRKVIIPPEPGVFSALGMLVADRKYEARRAHPKEDIEDAFQTLERSLAGETALGNHAQISFSRYSDARYVGQGWQLSLRLDSPFSIEQLRERFESRHKEIYGFVMADEEIEVVTIRVLATVERARKLRFDQTGENKTDSSDSKVDQRKIYYEGNWLDAPVFSRAKLSENFETDGPALIDEYGTTTYVPAGWIAARERFGSIVLRSEERKQP